MKTRYRGHTINSHPYYDGDKKIENRMLKIFVGGGVLIRHTPTYERFLLALDEAVLIKERGIKVSLTPSCFYAKKEQK